MTESIGHSMTWAAFALVITGVLLNAFAQLALKASVSDTGVINLDLQSLFSPAATLASNVWLWFGLIEPMSLGKVAGIGIIILGVYVLARS